MSPLGHHITAVSSLVVGGSLYLDFDVLNIEYSVSEFISTGTYYDPLVLFILFSSGFMFGSRCPDWLELSFFIRKSNLRVIKHRTLTHTPWLWLLLCAFSFTLPNPFMPVLFGICLSALLHVFIDMGSPTGIPLTNPFGKKTSFYLYRTNSVSELYIVGPFLLTASASVFALI